MTFADSTLEFVPMELDAHVLHLTVRWLHVAAMAAALGGAVLVVALSASAVDEAALLEVARGYEWIFWAAAGILVMTGIGNLGALGSGLPEPATRWGTTLVLKLSAVLALIVSSVPRTLAVGSFGGAAGRMRRRVRVLYGATAAAFALVLGIATWLAHG